MSAQPVEDLDDLQLVVQIGLEPQHQVASGVARRGGAVVEQAVALCQGAFDGRGVEPARLGQEGGPGPAQVGVTQAAGNGAVVQDVTPGQDRTGETGAEEQFHSRVTVGDVEHAGPTVNGCLRFVGVELGPGGGVALAGLRHPSADTLLEWGFSRHGDLSPRATRRLPPARPRVVTVTGEPRDPHRGRFPFAP